MRRLKLIQPWSARAFALGLVVVLTSTAVQALLVLSGVELYFATFLPAVFLAALLAGIPAAALVVFITVPLVWWAFIPPMFEFNAPVAGHVDAITTFLFLSLLLIFLGDAWRQTMVLRKAATSLQDAGTGD
jgi:K+-sensing histidine kinase KdpD